jgi:hypothetical protein
MFQTQNDLLNLCHLGGLQVHRKLCSNTKITVASALAWAASRSTTPEKLQCCKMLQPSSTVHNHNFQPVNPKSIVTKSVTLDFNKVNSGIGRIVYFCSCLLNK